MTSTPTLPLITPETGMSETGVQGSRRSRSPRWVRCVAAAIGVWGLLAALAVAGPGSLYEVRFSAKRPEVIRVRLILKDVDAAQLRLALTERGEPGNRRGTVLPHTVRAFTVSNAQGQPLPFEQAGTRYWTVQPQGSKTVHVSYEITQLLSGRPFGRDFGDRNLDEKGLDSKGAEGRDRRMSLLFDPAESLVYALGRETAAARIRLQLPKGWKAACSLKPAKGTGVFDAPSLFALFDNPMLLGRIHRTDFKVKGVPFSLVFPERPQVDAHTVANALKKIAEYQFGLFGVKPFERYMFLVMPQDNRRWMAGSDHGASSVYRLSRCAFERDNGRAVYALFARKLFKAWNTRYVHPRGTQSAPAAVLGGVVRTRARWFTDGVSDYYAHRSLVAAGLEDEAAFLDATGEHLGRLEKCDDYGSVSLARAAWDASASRRYPSSSGGLSCTSAGFLVGMVLDLQIRETTRGKKNLDHVMKFLAWWFGKKGVGYDDNTDLEKAVSSVAERDFSEFFARHVEGAERIPVEAALATVGLGIQRVEGATPCRYKFIRHLSRAGLETTTGLIRRLDRDNCLHAAGLQPGDRVVSIQGIAVKDHRDLDALGRAIFAKWSDGKQERAPAPVPVVFRRGGRSMKAVVDLPTFCRNSVKIEPRGGKNAVRPAWARKWMSPR